MTIVRALDGSSCEMQIVASLGARKSLIYNIQHKCFCHNKVTHDNL